MKITLYYFSQTGNTRKITKALATEFERLGHDVNQISIESREEQSCTESDLVGFGIPTFESHAPVPMKKFIAKLPGLSSKPSFLFATGGGAGGNVLLDLSRLLVKRGSTVVGTHFTLGEVHHPAACINGKSKGHPNKEDLKNAKKFASSVIRQIERKSKNAVHGVVPKRGFYNVIGAISSSEQVIRLLVPQPKCDSSNCSQCKVCSSHCPMDAITMSPTPVVGSSCIRCYRCTSVCATGALTANWWYGNLVVAALWNRHFMKWFGEYDGS